jgi:hypothetical protein
MSVIYHRHLLPSMHMKWVIMSVNAAIHLLIPEIQSSNIYYWPPVLAGYPHGTRHQSRHWFYDITPLLRSHVNAVIDALLLQPEGLMDMKWTAWVSCRGTWFVFASFAGRSAWVRRDFAVSRVSYTIFASKAYALEYGKERAWDAK